MCITGPSGCGKTECIRTLGAAHREMGHLVKTDIVCTEAVESEELLGYVDPETRLVIKQKRKGTGSGVVSFSVFDNAITGMILLIRFKDKSQEELRLKYGFFGIKTVRTFLHGLSEVLGHPRLLYSGFLAHIHLGVERHC